MGGGSKQNKMLKKVSKPARTDFCKQKQERRHKIIARNNANKKKRGNTDFDNAVQNLHARMTGPKKKKREGNLELTAPSFIAFDNTKNIVGHTKEHSNLRSSIESLLEGESETVQVAQKSSAKNSVGAHANSFALLDCDDDDSRIIELQPSLLTVTTNSDDDL